VTEKEIIRQRLINQQIAKPSLSSPEEIVSWLGAIQAQEYAMAKWAVGLRLENAHDIQIEKAFNDGRILRTHLLRPTWHFVTPEDIRWIVKLSAPAITALSAYMFRQLELDEKLFKRTNKILVKALEQNQFLTRNALQEELQKAKINGDGLRMVYIMMRAELDCLICSGPRQGKQFTYALLDDRAPVNSKTKLYNREESLTELAKRYLTSRGPASVHDFSTWSGIKIKDARFAIESVRADFYCEAMKGVELFFPDPVFFPKSKKIQSTFLMPDYDEYGMGYKDRSVLINDKIKMHYQRDGSTAYNRWIVVDGKIAGTWKKIEKGKRTEADISIFGPMSKAKSSEVNRCVRRYAAFFNKESDQAKSPKRKSNGSGG
jgi:hypothetical protein